MNDQQMAQLIAGEENRQRRGLELIPSENYVSRDVLDAMGSVLTNKYSEGYPGARYYGGQEFTDQIETIAIERAKQLFAADHANVQPHSGAQANNAVYNAWLEPGDTVLGMDLGHGGHLTHGAPVTQSAQVYNFVRYKVSDIDTGEFDYDKIMKLAQEHRPKILLVGYSAYSRIPDFAKFAEIGNSVGALLVADMAHVAGLIVGGQHPNPFDHGFHVITTTTHKTLRGPRGGLILSRGIVSSPLKKPEKTIENIPTLIDRSVFPGTQGGPMMHVIAAKAVAFREAMQPEFQQYAKQIITNSLRLAEALRNQGFKIVWGGTDNHLILIDVMSSFGVDGQIAEKVLDQVGLTVNKNAIPDDSQPPFRPSGIRLGTPAITTRGLDTADMDKVANWIYLAITKRDDQEIISQIRSEIEQFSLSFPLPSDIA